MDRFAPMDKCSLERANRGSERQYTEGYEGVLHPPDATSLNVIRLVSLKLWLWKSIQHMCAFASVGQDFP